MAGSLKKNKVNLIFQTDINLLLMVVKCIAEGIKHYLLIRRS